jgi:hypothetical protein
MASDHVSATDGKVIKEFVDKTTYKENVLSSLRKPKRICLSRATRPKPLLLDDTEHVVQNEADVSSLISSMSTNSLSITDAVPLLFHLPRPPLSTAYGLKRLTYIEGHGHKTLVQSTRSNSELELHNSKKRKMETARGCKTVKSPSEHALCN